jgi:DNA (cytosine-5)-methyltransferase 1
MMDGCLFFDPPQPGAFSGSDAPLIFDSFAGGGGASTGIEMALGRSPDIAVNHNETALSMHAANHPDTKHLCTSIYSVDPRDHVKPGQRVGLAWFSPDCKHHSKAKGGKPVDANIRGLAWVVVHWAELVRPEVIMLENVAEFQDWGPLTDENKPDPRRRGETFREWASKLQKLGYKVEWQQLRACDYGAPTIRKRLFLIARCDGLPIVWPEPTHGKPDSEEVRAGTLKPWRSAAEIIDWSIPCPSIFLTPEEAKAFGKKHGQRPPVRPLAENTLRRVAMGVKRYVLDAQQPFIVTCNHSAPGFRGQGLDEPFKTLTAARDAHGLVVPTLVQTGYGERKGQAPRVPGLHNPLGTITAGGGKHALITPHLMPHYGKSVASSIQAPVGALTEGGGGKQALIATFLAQHNGGNIGRGAGTPLSTLTTRGTQQQMVAAHLLNMHGSSRSARDLRDPHPAICAGGQHGALVTALLERFGHLDGSSDQPVTVSIDGTEWAIVDIGMRMLKPREQFRAQGFPESYEIETGHDGRAITQSSQTMMCGNSVCPDLADALAAANCSHMAAMEPA